jgi:hypothetical protein
MWNKVFEDNPNRQVWDLVVDTPMARKIKSETHNRHHMKFLPHGDYFSTFKFSDYIIFDGQVVIIDLDVNNPKATVIDSKQIAMSLKALHLAMWQLLPE